MSNNLTNNPEYLSGDQLQDMPDENDKLKSNPMMQGNPMM